MADGGVRGVGEDEWRRRKTRRGGEGRRKKKRRSSRSSRISRASSRRRRKRGGARGVPDAVDDVGGGDFLGGMKAEGVIPSVSAPSHLLRGHPEVILLRRLVSGPSTPSTHRMRLNINSC